MSFRAASSPDAAALAAFVNAAYRGEGSKRGWTSEADFLGGQRADEAMLREMIEEPSSVVELAFDSGELVGCVYLRKEPDCCYLGMLAVAPRRQGLGLGRSLLERAEETARRWDRRRLRMTVLAQRAELIAYYERRGFKRTGGQEPFPKDPRYGLPKIEGLVFTELAKDLEAPSSIVSPV
ncbi:MAG: GNAT family N-acetyltransferase [Elusimicrobia bacterium]|nr:GNAT family N-acetyltransferase [Elusimicrobiota bacterium]MDE2236675.1 GNAT family N-acetyltransferase [Elusimicrobiota bacterium]MDE2425468.1 GNAT family N-acetyltransferase [Elusimicrobiota bacterium]